MNNYVNTEKSLKRWLKSRVKITMATVVGFLIAGTMAFGAIPEIPTGDGVITIDQPDKQHIITSENTNENGKIVVDGKNTNNGGQTSSAFSVTQSEISLINKGDIWVTDSSVKGYAQAMGNNYQVSGTIINEGNIYVLGKDNGFSKAEDRVKGMAIDAGKAYNRGIIIVTDGVAMTDNSGTTEKTIINDEKGKIIVEGTGAGIYHRKEAITNGSIENKGTIEVTGKGTGVLIFNDKNEESYNGKSFINSGTIIANNGGKAISSSSKNFTLNLEKGSHIEGLIKLNGTDNTVNIDGVGTADKPEINNIESNDVNVKINNSNVILEGSLKNADGIVVELNNKDGNNTLVNNAEINGNTGIAVADNGCDNSVDAKNRLVSITNNGNITASKYGIRNNGYYTKHNKIEVTNNGNILVNNFEKSVSGDKAYYYNNGIYSASAPYTETAGIVKNTKEVKIDLTAEQSAELKAKYTETNGDMYLNIHGIRLHEHTEGYNTGDVIVNAFGGVGVALTAGDAGANTEAFKEKYGYFENSGNITVTGENVKGILIKNTTEAKLEAVNGANGVITVNGTNAVGAEVIGANSHFTNEGTIALGMNGTGNIAINNVGGVAKNTGIIKVTDMTKDEIISSVNKEEALDYLFDGEVEHLGLIVDKEDNALFLDEDTTVTEDTTTDILDGLAQGNGTVGVDGDLTITGTGNNIVESEVFNVTGGTATIEGEVVIDSGKINLDGEGKFAVGENSSLTLENGTLDKIGEGTAIEAKGTLALDNMDFNADISGTADSKINISGDSAFDGTMVGVGTITIDGNLSLSADSKVTAPSSRARLFAANTNQTTVVLNGNTDLEVGAKKNTKGEYIENFFHNSDGLLNVTGTGSVTVGTENIIGKKAVINLGENNNFADTLTGKVGGNSIYEVKDENGLTDGKLELAYKSAIFGNAKLDAINGQAYELNTLFSQDTVERKAQMDKIYSSNIYSETVRAAYDNVKMNEEAVESLARKSEVGKWTAEGKALYAKNEYDRKGIVKDYSSEVESTGLMAAFGYGVNETTTAGVAFSGVKQDVDTDNGSADADLFYLGVYGNKVVGNYDFTAGLGYQFGEYDADNNILGTTGDKYDTQALSGYVQGRYTADLGDGLSVQPKVKLGYTYIDQDNAKDSYFGVSDAEISTFDAEVGFDVVKSVQFEKSQADVRFGLSYTKAMGDTDKEFTGRFYGTEASNGFDVLGAELAENTVKFDLGAEVTNENGFFYNGGFTYEFGSNDTEAYGVNVGVGYKF